MRPNSVSAATATASSQSGWPIVALGVALGALGAAAVWGMLTEDR